MDWKDALGALRDSGEIPVDDTPAPDAGADSATPPNTQTAPLHVITDRKGRKGKTATIIEGFTLDDEEVENLAKTLKQKLGTGGSSRAKEILIQGDRKKEVADILSRMGYKVK